MPGKALHLPFDLSDAERVGKGLFRKQVLPVGKVAYQGQELSFTPEKVRELADNFNKGAFDQVPFVLVNEDNEHTDDPQQFRGEVKGLEAEDDGLYALIEMTDDGAELIEKNPKLGVSARIRPDFEKAGKKIGDVIQHVAGTLDPRAKGLKPWEAVELSDDSPEVVNLTEGEYSAAVMDDQLSAEDVKRLKALAARVPEAKDGNGGSGNGGSGDTELSDEDADKILAGLLESAKDEPQTVELSDDQRKAIELAEQKAKDAERRVGEVETRLATERWERQRDELVEAGIPPSIVNLCEPILKQNAAVIELSGSERVDAQEVVRRVLEETKGTLEFSEVGGNTPSADERQEAQEKAKEWAKANGGGS